MSKQYPHKWELLDRTTPSGKMLWGCRCGAESPAPCKDEYEPDCPASMSDYERARKALNKLAEIFVTTMEWLELAHPEAFAEFQEIVASARKKRADHGG